MVSPQLTLFHTQPIQAGRYLATQREERLLERKVAFLPVFAEDLSSLSTGDINVRRAGFWTILILRLDRLAMYEGTREYWIIYRGPGFLVIAWNGSSLTPSPHSPFSKLTLSFSVFLCVSPESSLLTKGGSEESKNQMIARKNGPL